MKTRGKVAVILITLLVAASVTMCGCTSPDKSIGEGTPVKEAHLSNNKPLASAVLIVHSTIGVKSFNATLSCMLTVQGSGAGIPNQTIHWAVDNVSTGNNTSPYGYTVHPLSVDYINGLPLGIHQISATYNGSETYQGTSGNAELLIIANPNANTTGS